jgi:hypothetical protein
MTPGVPAASQFLRLIASIPASLIVFLAPLQRPAGVHPNSEFSYIPVIAVITAFS